MTGGTANGRSLSARAVIWILSAVVGALWFVTVALAGGWATVMHDDVKALRDESGSTSAAVARIDERVTTVERELERQIDSEVLATQLAEVLRRLERIERRLDGGAQAR